MASMKMILVNIHVCAFVSFGILNIERRGRVMLIKWETVWWRI